ncbi:MAG: hypothetical protein FWC73_09445 [Defluviitaleaceae bacterium]|nr:hypothetical protein [Defluviitaleaceae bacterium]
MKKYLFILCLMAVTLIGLSACYDIQGASSLTEERVFVYEADTNQGYTQDISAEAISWQEAFSYKLYYYAQLPVDEAYPRAAEWRFMLHDIDQDGIPELFLILTFDNSRYIDHRAVYSFADGGIVRLKTGISGETYGGMLIPPGGGSGIIQMQSAGHVIRYDMLVLSGFTLSNVMNADVVEMADSLRINAQPVTEDEFEYVFGCRDEKVWLPSHEITKSNIRNIIFGW